jgi:hypothetical protein
MGIVSAKQLTEALQKARSVGMVEETFTIGDCEVTLRNLRPDEYEAVLQECKDLEDVAYLNKWQEGHVCRSIVQINGSDLRDIDFVEVEEPDPKKQGATRQMKRELHDWLRKNILSTWGKEAIFTGYRKFTDVVFLAENKAKENVKFVVAEETAEDKYRRLLGELKELEPEVPPPLVRMALEESGYTHYTQPQDQEALKDFDKNVPKPEGTPPPDAAPAAPAADAPPAPPPAAPAPPIAAHGPPDQATQLAQMMRQRVPLNQQPVSVPNLPVAPQDTPVIQSVVPASAFIPVVPKHRMPPGVDIGLPDGGIPQVGLDDDLRAAPPIPVLPPGMAPPPGAPPGFIQPPPPGAQVPMLTQKGAHMTDPRQLATIVNQPPRSGLNPKYRPHGQ